MDMKIAAFLLMLVYVCGAIGSYASGPPAGGGGGAGGKSGGVA